MLFFAHQAHFIPVSIPLMLKLPWTLFFSSNKLKLLLLEILAFVISCKWNPFKWLKLYFNSHITSHRHCILLNYPTCLFFRSYHSLVNLSTFVTYLSNCLDSLVERELYEKNGLVPIVHFHFHSAKNTGW